ncbi:hypothetical protein QYE76_035674 [Lolium multiflorum]|uniref:Retrotransposon gag domain-containing protein n=1 Tax=Lolium multiflorum TaxID=4521 RepID=A0AAD8R065_LOLMU|nr:hypothetical protein QYE76_035674 [Lolium multiflorum]
MVTANGQPIDACNHIVNDQAWRAHNRLNVHYVDEPPRQSAFNRKYDTHIDPTVWIDSYTMAVGIQGYTELLAARYLPIMMDGMNRQWFNTLPPNNIDSWEEVRADFIQHFASAYTRATTIEDLDRCIQGPRESTRRWVQRWQDMWTTSSDISIDTRIYCFRRCCRYEPLGAKLRHHSRDNISMAELFNIAQRYADEDPTVDSNGEYGQRCNHRPHRSDTRRDDYRFGTRPSSGKRRADSGNTEFVVNTDYGQTPDTSQTTAVCFELINEKEESSQVSSIVSWRSLPSSLFLLKKGTRRRKKKKKKEEEEEEEEEGNKRKSNGISRVYEITIGIEACVDINSLRDNRDPREDRPPGKRFDVHSLLDASCIYHSREGKPSTHTTANCFSLKQIEKARRAKENGGGDHTKDRNKDQD